IDCLYRENERLLLESQRSFEDLRATQGVQWRNQQGTRSPEARILFGGSRWAPHHQALYPDAQRRQRTQGLLRGEPIRTTTEALAGSCQTCREFCPYHWVENAKRDLASSMRQVDFNAGTVSLDPGTIKNKEGRVFSFTRELRQLLEAQRAKTDHLQR